LQNGRKTSSRAAIDGRHLVWKVIRGLQKAVSNIEVQHFEHDGRRLEELLLAGDIELAAALLLVNPKFESHPIARQPCHCNLPKEVVMTA
jgi:hypothetical protein